MIGTTLAGALAGGGTGASVALAGTKYNYLTHTQVAMLAANLNRCTTDACRNKVVANAIALSKTQDLTMQIACAAGPETTACKDDVSQATQYGALTNEPWYLGTDVKRIDKVVLNYVLGDPDGGQYYPKLDGRQAFFQAFENGLQAKGFQVEWLQVAANVSDSLKMAYWTNVFVPGESTVSKWTDKVGTTILSKEWRDFANLYNGPVLTGPAAKTWDKNMLIHEQVMVQPLYDKLYSNSVPSEVVIIVGGLWNGVLNINNKNDRIKYGEREIDNAYRGACHQYGICVDWSRGGRGEK